MTRHEMVLKFYGKQYEKDARFCNFPLTWNTK